MVLLIVLVASVLGADAFKCDEIKKKGDNGDQIAIARQECIQTGWCYWSSNLCQFDKCLKYISDEEYNTAEDTNTLCSSQGNGEGSVCKLYYLTGVPNCNTPGCPESSATDLYCRESASTHVHNIIDKCFYDDLRKRTVDPTFTPPFVNGTNCAKNVTLGESNYSYTIDAEDCSLLTSDDAICNCLGTKWCGLYPACTLNKDGKACVQDPCNAFSVGKIGQGVPPACTISAPGTCTGVLSQLANGGGDPEPFARCVSTSSASTVRPNNDTNECFYAYIGTETVNSNCADVRQCNKIQKNDSCSKAQVYGDDRKPKETAEYCQLKEIPGGYFPTNFYCSDGRTLPSFSASYKVKITTFFTVLLASVAFFISGI